MKNKKKPPEQSPEEIKAAKIKELAAELQKAKSIGYDLLRTYEHTAKLLAQQNLRIQQLEQALMKEK